jgi:hypothetical protein
MDPVTQAYDKLYADSLLEAQALVAMNDAWDALQAAKASGNAQATAVANLAFVNAENAFDAACNVVAADRAALWLANATSILASGGQTPPQAKRGKKAVL